MTPHDAQGARDARGETPEEQYDRNFGELLQELRVLQTGIQILAGFLLTLPFQSRFSDLHPALVGVFLAAAAAGTLSTVLIVAPAVAHRVLFRQHAKDLLVDSADRMAKAGLACLALTVTLVTSLVFGFVLGIVAAIVAGTLALVVFATLWVVVPVRLARTNDRSYG